MKKILFGIASFFAVVLICSLTSHASYQDESPFQVTWDSAHVKLKAGDTFNLGVTIRMPEGYYLYSDETEVDFKSLEGLIISDIDYPATVKRDDKYTGKSIDAYEGEVAIGISGYVPDGLEGGVHELDAVVRLKGCSPTLCYRPEERPVTFTFDVESTVPPSAEGPAEHKELKEKAEGAVPTAETRASLMDLIRTGEFSNILSRGLLITILIVFLAGVLTSLTPCVWPIIPAVLIFVGVHPHKKFRENLMLAACLTLGLTIVYSLLGLVAVAFGRNLGFLFQFRWFIVVVILFFVFMSLSMFGLFDVRMPRRLHEKLHRLGGEGYLGAFLAGLGLGLVASPCAGPVIAALLGYVALQRDYISGFGLLFVYSIGFGLLFIILGACFGELAHKLRGGPWLVWVKRTLGILLLFPAAFYMGSLFSWGGRTISDRPKIEWINSEADALKFATMTNRPIMMEFTANWCPPCKSLERSFFQRPDIVKLSYQLVPFKVDATVEDKEVRRLIRKYKVMGWPTVIFLAPDGSQYEDLRVSDYNPEGLEKSMAEALKRQGGKDL
jgi:thiol:disulfide interchange protein DsbD